MLRIAARDTLPRRAWLGTSYHTAAIVLRAARFSMARRSSIISALRPPCIVRAWRIRSIPAAVGPVLLPPCIRQRPFGIAACRHRFPLRVCAPQRGQDCAKDRCMRQLVGRMGFFGCFSSDPTPSPWALGD